MQGFGDGQAAGMALRQAGIVYVHQIGTTPDRSWSPKQELGIPASGFIRIFDGGFDGGSTLFMVGSRQPAREDLHPDLIVVFLAGC